jgi:predicted nucleic acid-binding protein
MLALDADVLVHWANADCQHHVAVCAMIRRELSRTRETLALVPQVCWEFLHVVTDRRRFDRPLAMEFALGRLRQWWDAPEIVRVAQDARVVHRTMELMSVHGLGRKRILDTVLAATLETAHVRRLATLNARDFALFDFIEVVDPCDVHHHA